ncbi:MAG: fimbrillin family protein, partial [Bacteroidales bacterium]|nr:fimbrillin family protein [Bacteroidales bacterium]
MKRHFFMAAIAAMTLGSCTNEVYDSAPLPDADGRYPITITTYTPRHTRAYNATAAGITNLTANGGGFSVTAISVEDTPETIINGATFYANASNNTCTAADNSIYFWPDEADVKFYAYYPITSDAPTAICSLNADAGTLAITPNGTADVMAAYTQANVSGGTNVALQFKHLLAQVVMKVAYNATNSPSGTQFKLTALNLEAPASATYNFSQGKVSANATSLNDYAFVDSEANGIPLSTTATTVDTAMIAASTVSETDKDTTTCTLTISFTTTIGEARRDYTKEATVKIISGYVNEINVSVSGDMPITVNTEVKGWDGTNLQEVDMADGSVIGGDGNGGNTNYASFVRVAGGTFSDADHVGTIENEYNSDAGTITIPDLMVCSQPVSQYEYEQLMTYYGVVTNNADLVPTETTVEEKMATPAYFVSWVDAIIYCNLRSEAEGLTPVYSMGDDDEITAAESPWTLYYNVSRVDGKYFFNS